MFGCAKPCRRLVLAALLVGAASGCMTPQMARKVDEALGLESPPIAERRDPRPTTAFDRDAGLPRRIWYGDAVSSIYHERRTNTFVAFDTVHDGWGAIPEDEAFTRGFKPARARLLESGPPVEVKKVVDYLVEMEPGWRGS